MGGITLNKVALEIHPKLKSLIDLAPLMKQLFRQEASIGISDTEKVIYFSNAEEYHSDSTTTDSAVYRKLDSNDPMSIILRTKTRQVINVPKEKYGFPLRIIGAPVFDDETLEIIGTVTVTTNVDTQTKLKDVAEQFAASSEEISASTEELSASATNFNTYMKTLSEAQKDMGKQVDNTTKILEMINSVAKNTRILGFNAGIEAARSGEYGRGFSVVAKEITKLADQSANSVNEIRNLLDQLKGKVDQVEKIVDEAVEISKNQTITIDEIAQNITNLAEVAEDLEELSREI